MELLNYDLITMLFKILSIETKQEKGKFLTSFNSQAWLITASICSNILRTNVCNALPTYGIDSLDRRTCNVVILYKSYNDVFQSIE